MSDPTIRNATEADADLLAGLIRESFRDVAERFSLTSENCPKHPSNCTPAWIKADQARGVQYYILSHNGASVGCFGLEAAGAGLCYLERLAVLPGFRGRGFGRALVSHAVSQAKRGGAGLISIAIIADHAELKDWYRRLGFAEVETQTFPHLPFRVTFMKLNIEETPTKPSR